MAIESWAFCNLISTTSCGLRQIQHNSYRHLRVSRVSPHFNPGETTMHRSELSKALCVCLCEGGETQQNRQRGNAKATIEQSQQSLLRHLNQLCRNSLDFGDEVWYVAGNTSNMKPPFSDMMLRTHVHVNANLRI